jgi:lincosamide nucleotidyltransferase A/C/D/E
MSHEMPADAARHVVEALVAAGVRPTVGGGWAIDALLKRQTRRHGDLDLWVPAEDLEALFTTVVRLGLDRLFPWGGERPWVWALHDGSRLRLDLHLYEELGDGFVHYGSALVGHRIPEEALNGSGAIDGAEVRCDSPDWALSCKTGHTPHRDVDLVDVPLLCAEFGFPLPVGFATTSGAD